MANPCLAPPPGLPQMPCRLACPAASAMPPSAFPSAPARPTVVRSRSSPGLTPRHHLEPDAKGRRAKEGTGPPAATCTACRDVGTVCRGPVVGVESAGVSEVDGSRTAADGRCPGHAVARARPVGRGDRRGQRERHRCHAQQNQRRNC